MFIADSQEKAKANVTLAGVERMAAALQGRRVNRTLTSRVQTRIFKFPNVAVADSISVEEPLHEEDDFKATLVSDPVSYLEKSDGRHYRLDSTLRLKTKDLLKQKKPNSAPLFLVTEHFGPIRRLELARLRLRPTSMLASAPWRTPHGLGTRLAASHTKLDSTVKMPDVLEI